MRAATRITLALTGRRPRPPGLFSGGRRATAYGTLVLLCAFLLTACDTTRYARKQIPKEVMQAYLENKPKPLHKVYRDVLEEGERNFVLNHMRAGLGAMELGHDRLAAESFEITLLSIEAVYAENESAEKARSVWYEEGKKDFKGEPYERAMAYYYRGLLFLKEGDYENARACFKSGQLQDALAENEKYQMDFALLIYLEGWASHLLGDEQLAKTAFEEAQKIRPDLTPPAPGDDVLVLAESGMSPVKVAAGEGQAALTFKRGSGFREKGARLFVNGRTYSPRMTEDIYWQASTRGGRVVDAILKDKVVFKETHETVGKALTELGVQGMLLSAQHDSDEGLLISGIVTAIGLIEQGVAASTQTRADDRYWETLPDSVHVFTYARDANQPSGTVTVSFVDPNGNAVSDFTFETEVQMTPRGHGLAWVRSRPKFEKPGQTQTDPQTGSSGTLEADPQTAPRPAHTPARQPSQPD
ncbi:tetratricopeptide repeat protein [Nitrospina gracilis]|uniref:tetratricopeptide repeat protein n=1 Tax=Nitrospina gracilis TaxID=35801 RepID=UPI001F37A436|nr:tetratricopeptide repeat protein [Nitrospina gracilis]MCF8719507.1 tetratricopeptide (TPR) repeat protein [Nitrospina gracilis Nb-211]